MKKITFMLFISVCCCAVSFGQRPELPDYSKEIDAQLWVHFKQALEDRDAEKFISLHTQDIKRITPWGIREGDAFRENIRKTYNVKNKPPRTIDFKFEHRIHSDKTAYEVGYFKVTYSNDEGQVNKSFGRFSVLLKKIDGHWKIDQDWDIDHINGVPIIEADYEKLD